VLGSILPAGTLANWFIFRRTLRSNDLSLMCVISYHFSSSFSTERRRLALGELGIIFESLPNFSLSQCEYISEGEE